jgi:radical SAM superfamily enzyme YgiQ (UPF0313 family)
MKVLLTHSWFMKYDAKQWGIMEPYPPLGTIWAAAVLRQEGFDVRLHDVMFEDNPDSIIPVLKDWAPDVLVICDDGFNYLTKMCLTNMRQAAWQMAKFAKNHGCKVIVSSSDATDHTADYLLHDTDYVIIGEVEQTLKELVHFLQGEVALTEPIAGIVWKDNDTIRRSAPRPVMQHLDDLPMPAWDLVDIEGYRRSWVDKHGYFSINCSTTRGCPFKCNWCAKPIYGNRYNARSPEHVVKELNFLYKNYGFDHVWFCDDIFGLKPGWVAQFAALLKKEKLKFRFKIQSRADLLLKDEQVAPLAEAGCDTVWMGAESGSQKVLDAMDKGITIAQIEEATQLLKAHGIKPAFFLQFGYPGEQLEDIHQTLDMLTRLVPEAIGISVSYPLPGTKFYETVKAQLEQKSNWTDSNDLDLMFQNTYSPAFYKQLHQHVHDHFRVLRANAKLRLDIKNHDLFSTDAIKLAVKLPYYRLKAARSALRLKTLQQ